MPRRFKLSRFVGAQIPDGFDPSVWGLGSMTESVDRLAAWNLVATVDAFISSGFEPAELLRWIHPTKFANTQGTGIGGMQSTRKMYVDALLGEQPPNDVLQEALPNVIAAHTVQSYLGGYGSMVHPVAACATAAVSVEEGVDKIRLDKASVVVTGGFDDLGIEGILGFGNMSATADTAEMLAKGIDEKHVCRPNDRRRGGFVEGQGGGTVVLARGDVAAELGLPVLGVVAYAGSFADGIHTSIPAPGIGALGAGIGGADSPLAKGLASLGLGADDLAVVSKHDTSTAANDPNESQLHEKLADALGRTVGSPLYVVSQKSLTGHAKGGAAAFQLIGLCQMLADGTIPPNRGLDCVDEALSENEHLVWLRQSLQTGPMRAGLLTSLGFGHVSAMVAVAHPGAFVAALSPEQRDAWLQAATARLVAGEARRLDAMCGGDPLFKKAEQRRFADSDLKRTKADESAMLVDPRARLGENGSLRGGDADDRRRWTPATLVRTRRGRGRRGRHLRLRRPARRARHPVRARVHPGERRAARSGESTEAQSLAARWAAKEAVIKAWSSTCFGHPEVIDPEYRGPARDRGPLRRVGSALDPAARRHRPRHDRVRRARLALARPSCRRRSRVRRTPALAGGSPCLTPSRSPRTSPVSSSASSSPTGSGCARARASSSPRR